ncbi:MAG: LLM class flavin-dependent oxidoreductase [Acidimicrobiaceae bacterium]|nr:LLM class flavin-dependent oxidoreductase [Acidimicrobiaceae bacterium]
MKFHCFNLMPWPHLPEDFHEHNPSVWIDASAKKFYDPVVGRQVYSDYVEILRTADSLGFDSVGVNEHHMNAYGLMPSPNLIAAVLARETTRANLLVLGNSAALYNPPIRSAEELAMVDVLSGGRLIAGFPIGTAMDSVFSYGQNPATLRDKYHEAVDLILKAWSAEEPFAWNGKYYQLPYVSIWPRPVQDPPPVWIPGGGSMEVWEYCIRRHFVYAYLSFFGLARSRSTLEGYWETVERLGTDRNPYQTAIVQFVAIADSDAEAERLYGRHAEYFYNNCLHVGAQYGEPAGYMTIPTLRRNLSRRPPRPAGAPPAPPPARGPATWSQIVNDGWVVAGSAETVRERLAATIKEANVANVIVQPHFGSLPKETALYNVHRFAADVMPVLRPTFEEWEDPWAPRPVPPVPAANDANGAGEAPGTGRGVGTAAR